MSTYKFSGRIEQGRSNNPFEREVEAESLDHARDVLKAELGSEHSVTRGKIEIENEEEA